MLKTGRRFWLTGKGAGRSFGALGGDALRPPAIDATKAVEAWHVGTSPWRQPSGASPAWMAQSRRRVTGMVVPQVTVQAAAVEQLVDARLP
eukprot:CAMPEP_0172830992 /NCGR_PEP_ID=MMETSP1075-20121228/22646_1 /TAXON_ID=2916 /ORGANISM="Ceratium fusus, Strain PA161109" /LENGTH=90 /DNA_ID=CAMNT_0013673371 /DNA_START=317 /DNA_END=587 /DNA_ORIENTATION=+